jgi:hypothetical protein
LPQEEFIFETQLTVGDFESFISHCCSSFCDLREEERTLFISIARELGNSEICSLLTRDCDKVSKSIVEYLKGCVLRHNFEWISCEEIGILAGHFHELPETLLTECPIDFLSALLSHRDLQIKDEDSLLTFLSSLWTSNPASFVLSEFVRFEFVSVNQIADFVESSFSFLVEFNREIWRSIAHRLIIPVLLDDVRDRGIERAGFVPIPFRAEAPLQGIVRYLSEKCGGNVHAKGVVRITASSESRWTPAQYLLDLDSENVFNSMGQQDQWFCYDFKDQRVILSHYSVRTYPYADCNPRSWVVESSVDGTMWTELDRKVESDDLCESNVFRTFPIAKPVQCRMVRFRQTGPTRADSNTLNLTAFEVFGTVQENFAH